MRQLAYRLAIWFGPLLWLVHLLVHWLGLPHVEGPWWWLP